MKIPVIFENNEVVVINKPSGLVTHADAHHKLRESVVGWFIDCYGGDIRHPMSDIGLKGRPGIVHRLDKPTSGAMVLAKTPEAYVDLVGQFKRREVEKEYLALVWGDVREKLGNREQAVKGNREQAIGNSKRMQGASKKTNPYSLIPNAFTIDAPIARHPGNPTKFAVVEDGRRAITEFEVVGVARNEKPEMGNEERKEGKDHPFHVSRFTLLRCFPETGRTHQIRVHLKAFGHPVVGDPVYQTKKQAQIFKSQIPNFERMMLHATRLGFKLPPKGDFAEFDAPLPDELEWMLEALGN